MKKYHHMLIDGKNAIYRAIFAGYYDQAFRKTGYDYFVILLRFVSNYVTLFKPDSVHIFWDGPRDNIWRRDLAPAYKDHRESKYKELDIDIKKEVRKQTGLALAVFSRLNCRQYYKPSMEADDLIYSFCVTNGDSNAIIVSSDQDFRQITQKMEHVSLYNPLAKTQQVENRPTDDIVTIKALMGDKSDNINGYYNIGPKRSLALALDRKARYDFLASDKAVTMVDGELEHVGDSIFKRNRRIIDLSWCPHLWENCEYVEYKQRSPIEFDKQKVEEIARKYRIRGLLADLKRYAKHFEAMC
jgi:DNA polymerase-1